MAEAPVLDRAGAVARTVELESSIFGAEIKQHLVHEAVRAEYAAARAGTKAAKSRGLVSGGRAKPWRQKGTGRARAGTIRAPQFTGGGAAFAPRPRSFDIKVNRKVRQAARRAALSAHAERSTIALLDAAVFGAEPSTKAAAALLAAWGVELPLLVVAGEDEGAVAKSFRNLSRVAVTTPADLETGALVWARSLLVTESAFEHVQAKALTR